MLLLDTDHLVESGGFTIRATRLAPTQGSGNSSVSLPRGRFLTGTRPPPAIMTR